MEPCRNFTPKKHERYYAVTRDGKIGRYENEFGKIDLFHIVNKFCWSTNMIPMDEIKRAVSIMNEIESDNDPELIKEGQQKVIAVDSSLLVDRSR